MVRKKNSESPVAEELVTPFIDQADFLKSELKHKNLIKNKLIEKIECSPSHFHLSTIKTGKKTPRNLASSAFRSNNLQKDAINVLRSSTIKVNGKVKYFETSRDQHLMPHKQRVTNLRV